MPKTGVLLLHGLTGVPSEMRPVEKYLQKLGFDIEAPVLAGHGGTHHELLAVTWKDWIESANAALKKLLKRVDQAVVCGLSMGGSIGAIVAANNPQVVGVVMLSPTLAYDSPEIDNKLHLRLYKSKLVKDILHVAVDIFPIIGRSIYWTETAPYGLKDQRLQRQITKAIEAAKRGEDTKFGLFRTYFGSLKEMNHITDEFKKKAPLIQCPSLIVTSMEDTLVSASNAMSAFRMLGSQAKSMVLLSGCDHVLTLDLKRNYVARMVGEFMEAVSGVTATSTDTNSQLTVEIHNRINPLTEDWVKLIPGGKPIMDVVPVLQAGNVHESQFNTLVVRYNNEPIMIVPSFNQPASAVLNAVPSTRPITCFAFRETDWGQPTQACKEGAVLETAWKAVTAVTTELRMSHGAKGWAFVDFESQTLVASKHQPDDSQTLRWLATSGALELGSVKASDEADNAESAEAATAH